MSYFKLVTGEILTHSESAGAPLFALNGFPLPFQTELMQLSPDFLARPRVGFSKRHL